MDIKKEDMIKKEDIIKKEYMIKKEDMDESKAGDGERPSYSELVDRVNEIAKPLAGKKLTKTIYRTTKKALTAKSARRGVREVTKGLRKGEKGFVVLAGDVTPIDVYSHLPVMCEDRNIPYCYVPSKVELGLAVDTKRPTCAVLVKCHDDFKDKYDKCYSEIKSLPLPF